MWFKDNIMLNITLLPEVLVIHIQEYVPISVWYITNKECYITNHKYITEKIDKLKMEKYIRAMIEQDNEFVFMRLLEENYINWLCIKNIYVHPYVYLNYICFLHSYATDTDSNKCANILTPYISYYENKYKKKPFKYIRWKHKT